MNRALRTTAVVGVVLLLAACARQVPEADEHGAQSPGFWWGLWHGFVFPFGWIGSTIGESSGKSASAAAAPTFAAAEARARSFAMWASVHPIRFWR